MTREEAEELFKKSSDFAVNYFDHTEVISMHSVNIVLNHIFDIQEAQLKAKDERIDAQRSVIIGAQNAIIAKDEEIERLKAKIEELDKLGAEMFMIDLLHGKDYKARSIVAMLFWEWRKTETRYQAEWSNRRDNRQLSLLSISSSKAEMLFKQAYKMLKDNA